MVLVWIQQYIFQVNNSTLASINSAGLYIGSYLLPSNVWGHLPNITSDVQTQLNNRQVTESYLLTSEGYSKEVGDW